MDKVVQPAGMAEIVSTFANFFFAHFGTNWATFGAKIWSRWLQLSLYLVSIGQYGQMFEQKVAQFCKKVAKSCFGLLV